MNELQVRLSADISALQSAITKAKATIKSFESETAKESEKGNVGFKRKIGLIEQLTNKAKALRVSLSQATNEKQVEQYNQALEETGKELTRLNSLGRSVTANLGSVGGGFGQVAKQGSNASGVAIEFNRVIQDAPFGLIGIGNNLQQLAGNFANVTAEAKRTGGTVGTALKASFASLVSPVNLGLLAISALTAGFTAYQMGAFDSILPTQDVTKSIKEMAEEIDNAASRTAAESANISALRSVIENETISRDRRLAAVERLQEKYPEIFGNANKEKLLNGELIGSYDLLTKAIIQRAEASLAEDKIPEINKEKQAVDSLIKVKQKQLETEQELGKSATSFVPQGEIFSEADIAKAKAKDLEKEIKDLETQSKGLQINIDGFAESIVSYQEEFINLLEPLKDSAEDLKVSLSNIFDEKDFVTQLEVIGKAVSQGLITPEQANLIKENISKSLNNAENTAIQESIQASLEDSFKDAISRFETFSAEQIDIPLDINFVPTEGGNDELGIVEKLKEQIKSINALRDSTADPTRLIAYNEQLKMLQAQLGEFTSIQDPLVESNKVMLDSFSALGIGIAASLDIGNKAFKGFVTTVLSAAPKIIQALIAQSAAKRAAASKDVATNAQVAASEGIAVGAKAANALGPVGLALLPVFIGGALALISGAFSKIGGGGNISGGGGGSMPSGSSSSGKAPQLFTNAFAPSIPASSSPTPSGSIDFDRAQGRLTTTVTGEDISFVYDRYQERKKGGG